MGSPVTTNQFLLSFTGKIVGNDMPKIQIIMEYNGMQEIRSFGGKNVANRIVQTRQENRTPLQGGFDTIKISVLKTYSLSILPTGELEPLIERPEESTLQRIDFKDLIPPASSSEVPSDFQFDLTLPEYVREQKIEFLLVQKAIDDKAWSFPTEETMHQIWNHVRNKLDSDYILDVCLWCRFEKSTSITSLMLSTVNLPVMEEVRHEIRKYHDIVGMRFETYNKTLFIKRYGISMYLPKEQAGLYSLTVLGWPKNLNPMTRTSSSMCQKGSQSR